jgi:hypothetical protein
VGADELVVFEAADKDRSDFMGNGTGSGWQELERPHKPPGHGQSDCCESDARFPG